MAKAMASVVSQANRAQASMPPNVLPPLIMQLDAGSVPVGYLVLQSKNHTLGEMGDFAQMRFGPCAIERARHDGHLAVWHQHPRNRDQRRSRSLAILRPYAG